MALTHPLNTTPQPYSQESTNVIYELLFCDSLAYYKNRIQTPYEYPWTVLLAQTADATDLQNVAADPDVETRIKALACHRLRENGFPIEKRELLAVVVEVGLDNGLDVLASYQDGTARYINHSERMVIWEAADSRSNLLTSNLFNASINIVTKIGPWDGPRRPHPAEGTVRISFLVSDGLYFGEGPINVLFSDALASPALTAATELMQYLTEKDLANR
jgi:hypothetical protein